MLSLLLSLSLYISLFLSFSFSLFRMFGPFLALSLDLSLRFSLLSWSYTKGKLLIIDVDNLDFVDNQEDLGYIIDRIDAQINGLF